MEFAENQETGMLGPTCDDQRHVEVVAVSEKHLENCNRARPSGVRAFTAVDLLVSITVIAVLIGILLPSLATVHETARRTVCKSNLRQIGFGIASFADERGGRLPSSVFKQNGDVQEMMTLRLQADRGAGRPLAQWDGLGLLHQGAFLLGPKVYYCPSHHGENAFSVYAQGWSDESQDLLVGNYQYRGTGRDGMMDLFRITPARTALVSDGMRTRNDYNHIVGANILRADLSTTWVDDRSGSGVSSMYALSDPDAPVDSRNIDHAWQLLDEPDGHQ